MVRSAIQLGMLAWWLSTAGQGQAQDDYDEAEESYADPESGDVAVSTRPTEIPGPLTVYAGARLGFGGDADYDPGGSDELITTFGLQAGADYVIMDYFALGGEIRMGAFNTDNNDDLDNGRSLLFDFVVRPRGRYVFAGMPLEVFGTLPVGLSVPSINDDWNADGKAGFTLGFGAGANYFFSERLGVGGELLYLKHWIGWESRVASGTVNIIEEDVSLGQINFVGNMIYAF